jgi:NAD(P)-dependent dehydrogenase (short-subunit alcohol dehydrogenase family)
LAALPQQAAPLPGRIVPSGGLTVSTPSIPALAGTPRKVPHDTHKGATQIFPHTLAGNVHHRGIRSTAPCPGVLETPHGLRKGADLQALGMDVSEAAIATVQRRIGTPRKVAQAALVPASDAASFGNGTQLFVDNGFTAVW